MQKRNRNWKPYVIGTGITGLWLVMIGSLLYRHVLPTQRSDLDGAPVEDPSMLTKRWNDTHEYMLLLYNKAIIGAASTVVQKSESPKERYVANFRLGATFGFAKLRQTISVRAVGELDSKFELNGFYVDANFAAFRLRLTGATRGTELLLDVDKNGQHTLSRLQLGRRISLLEAVRPALMQKFAIRPGATYVLPVADPMLSMEQGQVEIKVLQREKLALGGREVPAYKVQTRLNDFVTYSWVDPQGSTLRRQVVGNLLMERATEAEAKKVSPILAETVELPALDLEQFAKVKPQTMDQLSDGRQSPLRLLGGLLKAE